MLNKLLTSLIVITCASAVSVAQKSVFLKFPPMVGGNPLALNTNVEDLNGTTFKVERFNYYLSNIQLIHDGGQTIDLSDTVLLIEAGNFTKNLGVQNFTTIEEVNLSVGVPQSLNHEDISQYPMGHPLSYQSPSMHWGWVSGYAFMLLNAWGDGTGDGNPESIYQIHTFGDQNFKSVTVPVTQTEYDDYVEVVIHCNLDEWIYGADPGTSGGAHGEDGINAATMDNVETRNVFVSPQDASLESLEFEGELNYSLSGDIVSLSWSNVAGSQFGIVSNLEGKTLFSGEVEKGNGDLTLELKEKGIYLFTLYNSKNQILNRIKFIK